MVGHLLSANNSSDRSLLQPTIEFWIHEVSSSLDPGHQVSFISIRHLIFWPDSTRKNILECIWTSFMSIETLLGLVEQGLRALEAPDPAQPETSRSSNVMENIFNALSNQCSERVLDWTDKNMTRLLTFQNKASHIPALSKLIATCLASSMPLGVNNLVDFNETNTLDMLVQKARLQWRSQHHHNNIQLDTHHFRRFLETVCWTADHRSSISSCILRSPTAQREFDAWLAKGKFKSHDADDFAPVLLAFFESKGTSVVDEACSDEWPDTLFSSLIKSVHRSRKGRAEEVYVRCLAALISSFPSRRRRFGKAISKNIAKTASSVFGRTGVRLALLLLPIEEFETCVAEILAHSLRWSVEHLSSVGDEGIIDVSSLSILSEPASQWWKHRYSSRFLASLLKAGKSAAHGAESLITVFIQRHLCSPAVIRLVCALFETMPMKVSQSHYLFRFRKPTDHSR